MEHFIQIIQEYKDIQNKLQSLHSEMKKHFTHFLKMQGDNKHKKAEYAINVPI